MKPRFLFLAFLALCALPSASFAQVTIRLAGAVSLKDVAFTISTDPT